MARTSRLAVMAASASLAALIAAQPPASGAAAPRTATEIGTVTVGGVVFTGATIPFGKTVDVSLGSLLLKSATGSLQVTPASRNIAEFVLVRGTENRKPIVELRLVNADFSECPSGPGGQFVGQGLWGNGKGSFRVKGRYATATARGSAIWLTTDRCDGTLVKVKQGVVAVQDKHRVVLVPAGRSYLARA